MDFSYVKPSSEYDVVRVQKAHKLLKSYRILNEVGQYYYVLFSVLSSLSHPLHKYDVHLVSLQCNVCSVHFCVCVCIKLNFAASCLLSILFNCFLLSLCTLACTQILIHLTSANRYRKEASEKKAKVLAALEHRPAIYMQVV